MLIHLLCSFVTNLLLFSILIFFFPVWNGNCKGSEIIFSWYFVIKMIDFFTLNVWPKLECYNSSFKRETGIRLHCYVNKARVLHLLTNNVKKENYHFFDKRALEKQDKRIDWFINNIINKRKQYWLKCISVPHICKQKQFEKIQPLFTKQKIQTLYRLTFKFMKH